MSRLTVEPSDQFIHFKHRLQSDCGVSRGAGVLATAGKDLSKMTTEEVQALLRLLAEWERVELELVIQERREAERQGRLH